MSPIETQDNLSEDIADASENEGMKLVPVAESIRYRKRAQTAEKKAETLKEQLAEARSQAANVSEQLSNIRTEQKLTRKLAALGTVDLEAAVLIAKARMADETEEDLDDVIEQLKKEKQYLFPNGIRAMNVRKTAGAKERPRKSQATLATAAKKAAATGSRTDLHEYLKLRRNFL
jgi:hypothetical protein